jgi:hypothetical protein
MIETVFRRKCSPGSLTMKNLLDTARKLEALANGAQKR